MRLRILVSYHYYKASDLDKLVGAFSEPPEVFADSGGFSAKSLGVDITVDEYAKWLHRWGHLFTAYASLDVIGDVRKSVENLIALESLGLRPLPVFHGGEDLAYLDGYLKDYPYVALGGVVSSGATATMALKWGIKVFQMAKATGTLYHGFGQTTQVLLRNLPWYTVDSSSWGGGHRYGMLVLWDDHKGKFIRVPFHNHAAAFANAGLIRAHGGDPLAVARKNFSVRHGQSTEDYRADRRMAVSVNVTAWLRLEHWLQARHGAIGPPEATRGPKIYLADARPGAVNNMAGDLQLASQAMAGPKIYLAEGSWDNHAADVSSARGVV